MSQAAFWEALDCLSTGERAALRRMAGQTLQDADARAMAAFYRCLHGNGNPSSEDRWFAAACFHCLWDAGAGPRQPLEHIMRELKENSDSIEHRLVSLLDIAWDIDGYLLAKLSRIVKMARQKGYCVDCRALLEDLLYWNSDTQYVQRKWVQAMYYNKEERDNHAV